LTVSVDLVPDQEFLRDTTARFLGAETPVDELRRLRDDPRGFDETWWRRGADLGWTSLLVAEELGGGSVSGRGLVDLSLIAYEFGHHAAPGPLGPANVVAGAVGSLPEGPAMVAEILAGAPATWCVEEPAGGLLSGQFDLEVRPEGDEVVIEGIKRPVESAAQAQYLLVSGRSGDGITQVVVPAGTAGVSFEPMSSVDLTRRFFKVTFDSTRVTSDMVVGGVGRGAEAVQRQLGQALVVANAESVGAMARAFDMTVEWAFDRYSFGRPLASYQELKHRFADMKSWLEAGQAIADASADAAAVDAADAPELLSAAKAFIGHYGVELVQDCVQIHGGIGVTFDHDLHLFLRRVTLNSALWGTPAAHRQRLADLALAQEQP
jgi:alkylation response protein AidB-like acyl-CoA dehydrogenase